MDAMSSSAGRPRVRMTGAQRRQQLLNIGRELFGRRGYEATSIEEIAARADVSKPVVYEHFGGKEGLYTRSPDKEEVAAHLVNLAYNGLSHLDPHPGLVDGPETPAVTGG